MIKLPKLFSNFEKRFGSVLLYNKKILILGISLGLFLCFFSIQTANAYIPIVSEIKDLINYVLSLPVRIPFLILVITIGVIGFVCSVVFTLVASLLSWLIEASLSIQVVPGEGAFDVVNVGFEFTKNFANMFIILILAIIGLATILKIREYEARKLLPKLLMVALLINFTPVIVGFIVDIANLFTNFFFTEIIKSGALTSINLDDVFNIINEIGTVMDFKLKVYKENVIIETLIPIIVKGIMMILFYSIATIVYLLVFLLFFVRFIMLWILVILAPIAFFSQILPASPTVKALLPNILHWDKWWETLIQWAVIGIPLGFFLYLSAFIITTLENGKMPQGVIMSTDAIGSFSNIIGVILGPMIAIFILIMGIMISIESVPGVAKGIIKRAKGFGKGVGKRATGVVGQAAKRVTGVVAGGIGGTISRVPGLKKFSPGLLGYKEKTRQDWAKQRTATPEGFKDWDTKTQVSWTKAKGKRGSMGAIKALGAEKASKMMEENPDLKDKFVSGAKSLAGRTSYRDEVKMITDIAPEEFSGIEIAKAQGYKEKDIDDQVEKMEKDGMFEKFGTETDDKKEFATKVLHMEKVKLEETSKNALISDAGKAASVYRNDPQFFVKAYEKLGKDKFNKLVKGGINAFDDDSLYRISPRLVRASYYNRHFKEVTGRELGKKEFKAFKEKMKKEPEVEKEISLEELKEKPKSPERMVQKELKKTPEDYGVLSRKHKQDIKTLEREEKEIKELKKRIDSLMSRLSQGKVPKYFRPTAGKEINKKGAELEIKEKKFNELKKTVKEYKENFEKARKDMAEKIKEKMEIQAGIETQAGLREDYSMPKIKKEFLTDPKIKTLKTNVENVISALDKYEKESEPINKLIKEADFHEAMKSSRSTNFEIDVIEGVKERNVKKLNKLLGTQAENLKEIKGVEKVKELQANIDSSREQLRDLKTKIKAQIGKIRLKKEISELREELEEKPSPFPKEKRKERRERRKDLKRESLEKVRRDVERYKKAKEVEEKMKKDIKEAEEIAEKQRKKLQE